MTSHALSPDLTVTPTPTSPQSSRSRHPSAPSYPYNPTSPTHTFSGSQPQPTPSSVLLSSPSGSGPAHPAMAMTAPAMSQSSSFPGVGAGETSSFDLPPMPVPYEDFHFSLDLPENINASDLSLLQNQTDFHGLFGTSSAMHTPSIVSGSALFGSATPLVRTPAPLVSQEPQPPQAEAESSSLGGAAGQLGSEDAVMTSMQLDTPASSASSNSTLRAGPPPPPDFEPPPAPDGSAFSFNSLLGGQSGQGSASFDQSLYPGQHFPQQQQQQQQQFPGMRAAPMVSGPGYHSHPQYLR